MADQIIDATVFDEEDTAEDESLVDVNGLLITHPEGGAVSGTGGFQPFLRQNNSDGVTTGFNTSDTNTLNNGGTEGLDMEKAWTTSLKVGDLPIVMIDGVAYYEIRLDLNEENSGTDGGGDDRILLELSELQIYTSTQQATLADYTAGSGTVLDSDFNLVYDLDSGGVDRSIMLTDGPSGSGNDDYIFYVPVSAVGTDPDLFFTLFAQFGPQPAEGATFEEFRIQNTAQVNGIKFNDADNDGIRDAGEDGLEGFVMYIDANGNNLLDVGEVTAESDADGAFTFYGLIAGTYVIREVLTEADLSAGIKAQPGYVAGDYLPPTGFWSLTTGLGGDHGFEIVKIGSDLGDATVQVGNHELTPNFTIDKSVLDVDGGGAGGSADESGDVITYRILLTNNGELTLTGVTVTDPFADTLVRGADAIGDNDSDFEVGEQWVYTATHTVTQSEIDGNGGGDGDLDNTATADTDQVGPKNDSEDVPVIQSPALIVNKVVQDVGGGGPLASVDAAGDIITYDITVTNTGNVTLTNVVVADPLTGTNINIGSLAPGATYTVQDQTYTAVQADIDGNGGGDGDIDNTSTADSDQTGPAQDSEDVPIDQNPLIDIEKFVMTDVNGAFEDQDDPDGPAASTSSVVDFKVVLTNTGNVTLTNITLSDTVVHTVGGVAGAPEAIDYSDPALGAFIDLDDDGLLDAGEEWSNFDTNSDGTLDIDENGDPFELSIGETVNIYYSLTSELGQHENTAEVTAAAATTGQSATDADDANYFVLATDDCVGVRTPGFWQNSKWMTFWDGKGDGWGTAPNEPGQAGTPGFADGELLYGVDANEDGFVNHVANDGVNDDKPLDAKGLLIGDYNQNGITDAGEDTIFVSLPDAIKLINASSKQLVEGKGTADGIFMLGRDMVATWLNYLANNQDTIGECIGDVSGATNTPREYLDAAIDWMQQFASDQNSSSSGTNQNTSFHDGNTQALFQFDARVNPNSASWQTAITTGEDISVSAASMHAALDAYNNTGAINGIEFCCDADSEIALAAIAQII